MTSSDRYQTLPIGVVLRKSPGVTRWQSWVWRATGVLPGAAPTEWRELRREGEVVEYHAATKHLELHGADTEAYLHELEAEQPSVYVVMRAQDGEPPLQVLLVTASPYEAQDYTDGGDDIVERVPMPPSLRLWVEAFVNRHHNFETFVKRQRSEARIDQVQDGIGDPRVVKEADIYASPTLKRQRLL